MSATLNVVGLVVADMPASLAFYRRFGWDIPAAADTEQHVEFTLPSGLRIAWDTETVVNSFDAGWKRPVGGPRMSLAFECDSPAAVDALYTELVAGGAHAHKEPWDAAWRQRYAIVHDPDGNSVDMFCEL